MMKGKRSGNTKQMKPKKRATTTATNLKKKKTFAYSVRRFGGNDVAIGFN